MNFHQNPALLVCVESGAEGWPIERAQAKAKAVAVPAWPWAQGDINTAVTAWGGGS